MPFSAAGKSFEIHEWRGSGPATLHVHYSDDEAWHVPEGELTFRYADRTESAGPGTTVFRSRGDGSHLYGGSGFALSDRADAAIAGADCGTTKRSRSSMRSIAASIPN